MVLIRSVIARFLNSDHIKGKNMHNFLSWIIVLVVLCFNSNVTATKIKNVIIPSVVIEGQNVVLKCEYDMENSQLYLLRWLKDNLEFYRYSPDSYEPVSIFETTGVHVDIYKSINGIVHLKNATFETSGEYFCEVNQGAPLFIVVTSDKKRMKIIKKPINVPVTSNGSSLSNTADIICLLSTILGLASLSTAIRY